MVDCENPIFDQIATVVRAKYEGVLVSGEYSATQASFPAVTIVEMDNSVYEKMSTNTIENYASLVYQCDVYSNKIGYKKQEARDIMKTIDQEFAKMGFTRTMCNPMPNLQDSTIFRLTARYEAVVSQDLWVYTE
jgi:hypothetical protein